MNVLITGCASGIAKSTMDWFLRQGHSVYALDINEIDSRDNLKSFVCDILDSNSLNGVKDYLVRNNVRLDVILNIAGIHRIASFVESDYTTMEKVIDVNLLGNMLVNRVFHSVLNEKGRVVIVTSEVAFFDPMPFNALYNVSKTALDCYAQGLRQELNLLNQKVVTIRIGAVETPLSSNSLLDIEKFSNETVLYKRQAGKFLGLSKKFMGKPMKSSDMGRYIYRICMKKRPRVVYKKHQNIGLVLMSMLPKRWQCGIIKLLLK